MFTGIITDIGRLRAILAGGDTRFEIETRFDLSEIDLGASISCSGACLTVVAKDGHRFAVDASAETLSRTTLGGWREGQAINLERALKLGDELGGHLVSGHVDGVIEIRSRESEGDSVRFTYALPDWLHPFIAPKGSVALDGVSLTVNQVEDDAFGVNIIPHTQTATTFGDAAAGGRVNVEIDMLARYVNRALAESGHCGEIVR
ncbi:MAG: riboflavin synthase [Alphaproteobacteria bacterium]|jgi:riboflavin synthase|nr:riboflavin synthase [Alphaproteobacteria bacterium]MDP6515475.1 riboflavin synthase [Alphaproteobacteria bacterium]